MLPKGLLKEYSRTLSLVVRALDMTAIVVAGLFAYYAKFEDLLLPQYYAVALCLSGILTLVIFSSFRVYESIRVKSFWQYITMFVQAAGAVFMLLAGTAFLTKSGQYFSREWFIWWFLLSLAFLMFFRGGILIVLRLMRSNGWNERRVILIGAGELGAQLAKTMQQALWTGFRIVTILDDEADKKPAFICGIPVLATPQDINAYLFSMRDSVDEIWLAMPLRAEERVKELLYGLRHHTVAIRFVLDIFGLSLLNHSITDLAGFPTLNLNSSPMVGVNRFIKAVEDRVIAALILIFISPLFLLIAIGVKLSSKGPVFFKQLRHGWDGRVIKVYKFRTMVQHHETEGKVTQATANDERITRFGKFLRKTSLDELPQFFNVLQGRMSIVGPRPHALSHNEFYKDSIKAYMQRHQVKPGITGWAQVNGWRGETESLEKMEKRVEYDLYYIENWSLLFDLKIIFLTLFQGFVNKNAY